MPKIELTSLAKNAASRIGVPVETYISKRNSGFRWCPGEKHWVILSDYGRGNICKGCGSIYRKARRLERPDPYEVGKSRRRNKYVESGQLSIFSNARGAGLSPDSAAIKAKASRYAHDARKRGLAWKLSVDQCRTLFASNCFYCGRAPSNAEILYRKDGSASATLVYNGIDRVDNKKGYLPSNSVPCCRLCNQRKSDSDMSEWIEHAGRVFLHRLRRTSPDSAALIIGILSGLKQAAKDSDGLYVQMSIL